MSNLREKELQKVRTRRYKAKVKGLVNKSNEAELKGLPPDPWVVAYRESNNKQKARWKSKQEPKPVIVKEKKEPKPRTYKPLSDERRAKKNAYVKQWHKDNKEKVNEYKRIKREKDPSFKIACNLRKRLSFLLSKCIHDKTEQTLSLLGCTMQEFMNHLQSLFKEGMSFENYGKWHIDHKLPCASFDLTQLEQRKICFHYSNMQPLWDYENRIKSDRIF